MSWVKMFVANNDEADESTSDRPEPETDFERRQRQLEEIEIDRKLRSVLQVILTITGFTVGFGSAFDTALSVGLVIVALLALHPDVF